MSVYKSARRDSQALFISAVRNLRVTTVRLCAKFPKSYRWIATNNMMTLAASAYSDCIRGNTIFLHNKLSTEDFNMRCWYFRSAETSVNALLAEITFLYDYVRLGNNFFDDKFDYQKQFRNWTDEAQEALNLIRGVMKSDKERWKSFGKVG